MRRSGAAERECGKRVVEAWEACVDGNPPLEFDTSVTLVSRMHALAGDSVVVGEWLNSGVLSAQLQSVISHLQVRVHHYCGR